ncbi:unnamed protein product [Rhizophagus irregularis]|nr:unnamed protein product [Rhizophagus irregularis]
MRSTRRTMSTRVEAEQETFLQTRQSQQRGRKGRRKVSLFKELKDKAHISNPTAFMLPENIRNTFDGAWRISGFKQGETVQLDKRGYPVEPDRERFVDTKGRSICCYYCKLPPRHLRPIMSCDFCDQHWHFDCLTPPLTIAPPLHKKWMCPLHADHVLPPMRRLRGEDVLPYMDNTAIEHQSEKRRIECDPEFYLNDTLHKLPRQSVRLDWIGQMKTALEENNEKVIAATERHYLQKKKIRKWRFSFFLTLLLPIISLPAAIELLDEDVQMTMAIELSQMKSRLECDGKENEKEDEGAGPSRSNCDNYGDERIAKRLRPEDYESSVSSSSSTNVRVHTEPVEVGPENLKVEERTANRFHQYNEIHDKNEDIIGNNAESIENKTRPRIMKEIPCSYWLKLLLVVFKFSSMPGTIFEQLFEQFFLNATGAAIRRQINLHLYINKKYYLEKSWIDIELT